MDGHYCGASIVEALNTNVYGNGTQTLVLSHGFGTDQTVWHHLVPYLACFFKVVIYDLAFSRSGNASRLYSATAYSTFDRYASDLVCVMDQMNVSRAIFMGHSMSAMIGCIAAAHRPELFEHLVLLGGSPRYLNEDGYYGGFEQSDLDAIFSAMGQNYSGWVDYFAPKAIGLNDTIAVAEFENSLESMNPGIALGVAETVFSSDLRAVLPNVTVPCTVIQSRKDIVVPEAMAQYIKTQLGNGSSSRVEILETEGHFPMLTAYPLLLNALENALKFSV